MTGWSLKAVGPLARDQAVYMSPAFLGARGMTNKEKPKENPSQWFSSVLT